MKKKGLSHVIVIEGLPFTAKIYCQPSNWGMKIYFLPNFLTLRGVINLIFCVSTVKCNTTTLCGFVYLLCYFSSSKKLMHGRDKRLKSALFEVEYLKVNENDQCDQEKRIMTLIIYLFRSLWFEIFTWTLKYIICRMHYWYFTLKVETTTWN